MIAMRMRTHTLSCLFMYCSFASIGHADVMCYIVSSNCWLKPATRIPPQPSHTETPSHIETRTRDQCGDTIEKPQAPDDGCINIRNRLSTEEVK